MKCLISDKNKGTDTIFGNIRGLSVGSNGEATGELVLIDGSSFSHGKVHRLKRWEWDRVLITKDMDFEKP